MMLARMVSTMAKLAEEWNCSASIERRFCKKLMSANTRMITPRTVRATPISDEA